MATKQKATAPASSPAVKPLPQLSDTQKFRVRDAQLRISAARQTLTQAAQQAQQADIAFRAVIQSIVEELKIDTSAVQLNLETLEFEKRGTKPAGN